MENVDRTFIRCEPYRTCDGAARGRSWMGAVDTETGQGFAHAQSPALNGRKYWNWGNASDTNRQNALSLCPGANETFAPVELRKCEIPDFFI